MPVSDRFIPVRSAMDLDLYDIWPPGGRTSTTATTPLTEYRRRLEDFAFGGRRRFLACRSDEPTRNDSSLIPAPPRRPPVLVPRLSYVDTINWPGIHSPGDLRLNAMDWSSENVLAMAVDNRVYLVNYDDDWHTRLMTAPNELGCITSLAWAPSGVTLAIGFQSSFIQLWETNASKRLTYLELLGGGAITSICWNSNHMCTFGREDGRVINCDVSDDNKMSTPYKGHGSKVSSLKWSPGGMQLATGFADGLLHIWDLSRCQNLHKFREDQAWAKTPIKGLSWCRSNILASAAGRTLELWNTATGSNLRGCDTTTRVTGLVCSPCGSELLTSHWSQANRFTFWKSINNSLARVDASYETLTDKVKSPVLSMSLSKDGRTVVTVEANRHSVHLWRMSKIHGTRADREAPVNSGGVASLSHIRYNSRTLLNSLTEESNNYGLITMDRLDS